MILVSKNCSIRLSYAYCFLQTESTKTLIKKLFTIFIFIKICIIQSAIYYDRMFRLLLKATSCLPIDCNTFICKHCFLPASPIGLQRLVRNFEPPNWSKWRWTKSSWNASRPLADPSWSRRWWRKWPDKRSDRKKIISVGYCFQLNSFCLGDNLKGKISNRFRQVINRQWIPIVHSFPADGGQFKVN